MNRISRLFAVASLASLAALAAHAETYEGVLDFHGQRSRAEVAAEARAAVRSDIATEFYGQGAVALQGLGADRATVRAQAVEAAHSPTANLDAKAFVNSRIPAEYTQGSLARRSAVQTQAAR